MEPKNHKKNNKKRTPNTCPNKHRTKPHKSFPKAPKRTPKSHFWGDFGWTKGTKEPKALICAKHSRACVRTTSAGPRETRRTSKNLLGRFLFCSLKNNNNKYAKRLPKWHQQEANTEPKTTKSPTQNHIKKNIENKGAVWSSCSMEAGGPADCAGAVGHQDLAKNRPFKI